MIMSEFKAAGYTVVHKLLNASEYGVPQNESVSSSLVFGILKTTINFPIQQKSNRQTERFCVMSFRKNPTPTNHYSSVKRLLLA